jgi:hypothetical protein
VAEAFKTARGLHGSPRLHADLREAGWTVSEKTLAREIYRRLPPRRASRTPPRTPTGLSCEPLDGYRSFNAAAEALFSSVEWESCPGTSSPPPPRRATVIDWCYDFYNHQRRHSAAAGMSPINYETAALTREAA